VENDGFDTSEIADKIKKAKIAVKWALVSLRPALHLSLRVYRKVFAMPTPIFPLSPSGQFASYNPRSITSRARGWISRESGYAQHYGFAHGDDAWRWTNFTSKQKLLTKVKGVFWILGIASTAYDVYSEFKKLKAIHNKIDNPSEAVLLLSKLRVHCEAAIDDLQIMRAALIPIVAFTPAPSYYKVHGVTNPKWLVAEGDLKVLVREPDAGGHLMNPLASWVKFPSSDEPGHFVNPYSQQFIVGTPDTAGLFLVDEVSRAATGYLTREDEAGTNRSECILQGEIDRKLSFYGLDDNNNVVVSFTDRRPPISLLEVTGSDNHLLLQHRTFGYFMLKGVGKYLSCTESSFVMKAVGDGTEVREEDVFTLGHMGCIQNRFSYFCIDPSAEGWKRGSRPQEECLFDIVPNGDWSYIKHRLSQRYLSYNDDTCMLTLGSTKSEWKFTMDPAQDTH
jgi:hypothetical protein